MSVVYSVPGDAQRKGPRDDVVSVDKLSENPRDRLKESFHQNPVIRSLRERIRAQGDFYVFNGRTGTSGGFMHTSDMRQMLMDEKIKHCISLLDSFPHLRWTKPPKVVGGVYEWPNLSVVKDAHKGGSAVISKSVIRKGLIIPYIGKRVSSATSDYTYSFDNHESGFIDGDPTDAVCAGTKCIASYINEASPDQQYNCAAFEVDRRFLDIYKPNPDMKKTIDYRYSHEFIVYVAMVDIPANAELTCYYGEVYDRDYKIQTSVTPEFYAEWDRTRQFLECLRFVSPDFLEKRHRAKSTRIHEYDDDDGFVDQSDGDGDPVYPFMYVDSDDDDESDS